MNLNFELNNFFETYWHKQPILFPKGIDDFIEPISADELTGLASEDEISSQLTMTVGDDREVKVGPIDFESLPPNAILSLSVQAANHWHLGIHTLATLFNQFPQWVFNEVTVNYSMAGDICHSDPASYDRLIIQGQGSRRWHIQKPSTIVDNTSESTALEFDMTESDVLYVPAGCITQTQTQQDSLTYTLNFRSPSQSALFRHLGDYLQHSADNNDPISLPSLSTREQSGAISADDYACVEDGLRQLLDQPDVIKNWLGEHLSGSQFELDIMPAEPPWQQAELREFFEKGGTLNKVSGLKALYHTDRPEQIYVNGECFVLPQEAEGMVNIMCNEETLSINNLNVIDQDPIVIAFITEMANFGYWYPAD